MSVAELLENSKKTLFSFEILPPLRGHSINHLYTKIDKLIDFSPSYINITSHRDEVSYQKTKDGFYLRKIINHRPGTVAVSAAIKNKYKIHVVPHMICTGFSIRETENALIDLHYLDINDLLLLRGDKLRKIEKVEKDEQHNYATDLIHQVNQMNKGYFSDASEVKSFNSNFSFGVAGYPEKHEEAPNMESDLYYLKKKIKANARYIVTQMFFNNKKYFDYVNRVREKGIDVPIVPGIKPISFSKQINQLPLIFNVDLPEDLAKELRKCKTEDNVKQVGIEWTIEQCRELIDFGVPSLHFYTYFANNSVQEIVKKIY